MSGVDRPAGPTPRPVRVLVNAIHAKSGGGLTYLRNLLPLLAEDPGLELHLMLHPSQVALFAPLDPRLRLHHARYPLGFVAGLAWEQVVLPVRAWAIGADMVFSPANYGPLAIGRQVIVLQNSLAVAATEDRWGKRLYWAVLAAMTRASLWRARAAVAVSDYVARAMRHPARAPVTVVHHGVAPRLHPPAAPRAAFLLAVGDLYVQKNLHTLLDALAIARRTAPDLHLRVVGAAVDPGYRRRLDALVAAHGLADHVAFLGSCPPDTVADLYQRCGVFVFPSTEESFGMPVLEAMASGCAIACAHAAAMPEIAGDTALYFDAHDADAMAATLLALAGDPALRTRLSAQAVERAATFSWRRAADATAEVIKRAAR